MWRINTLIISLWCVGFSLVSASDRLSKYRSTITFYAFSESHPNGTASSLDDTLENFDCDTSQNTTFVVHGWLESVERPWVRPLVKEFLNLRGGCVFVMDYSRYSTTGYFRLTPHFYSISDLLTEKVRAIAEPRRMVMFGFSFGARLVIHTGVSLHKAGLKVSRIFACDPAGPGFGGYKENNLDAANQVQCIHTSNNYGTPRYDCSQNWRMGNCGWNQPGHRPFPYGSHGLCPYIFTASFEVDFVQQNYYNCSTARGAKDLPDDLIMGPRETRIDSSGDIFAPTAKNPPWNVVDGVVENAFVEFPQAKIDTKTLVEDYDYYGEDLESVYNELQFYEEL